MRFLLKLLLSPKTVLGMAVGGAAAWFADPEKGAERRAQAIATIKERTGSGGGAPTRIEAPAEQTEPTLWTPADSPASAAV
jgi:hypothetical protein